MHVKARALRNQIGPVTEKIKRFLISEQKRDTRPFRTTDVNSQRGRIKKKKMCLNVFGHNNPNVSREWKGIACIVGRANHSGDKVLQESCYWHENFKHQSRINAIAFDKTILSGVSTRKSKRKTDCHVGFFEIFFKYSQSDIRHLCGI